MQCTPSVGQCFICAQFDTPCHDLCEHGSYLLLFVEYTMNRGRSLGTVLDVLRGGGVGDWRDYRFSST